MNIFRFFAACVIVFSLEVSAAKTFQVLNTEGVRLHFTSFAGELEFKHSPSGPLKIHFESEVNEFAPEKKDNKLIFALPEKEGELQKVKVLVEGPSVPFDLFLKNAKLKMDGWQKSSEIRLIEGDVQITKVKSDHKVFVRRGKVDVENLEGSLWLDTVFANINLRGGSGTANIDNFSGRTNISNFKGVSYITSHDGKVQVSSAEGEIHYTLNRAQLRVGEFKGKIHGKGKDSIVRLAYKGKADISVRSDGGNVWIKSPQASGARVNVGSVEGFLGVPKNIKKTQWPSIRVAKGRLDGYLPGNIYVRTKSGAISLK